MKQYVVAVVGATGAVGEEMLRVLEEQNFPIAKLVPLASNRSAGNKITYKNEEIVVQELTENVFAKEGVEIALFSAGGSVSAKYAPHAAKAGAVVIDNTSYFRMEEDIPLVVPEVNPEDIKLWKNRGIIANPNCSTIQMVMALKPLDQAFDIKRVDVATYQAVSGAGKSAMEELVSQMQDFFAFKLDQTKPTKLPHRIALNLIPQIDSFTDSGYTKEELKMVNETTKIMHKKIPLSATCVRVPVLSGHSEAVSVKFSHPVTADEARAILSAAQDVVVIDEPQQGKYPMPKDVVESDFSYVGRIRQDLFDPTILHFWIVADNLRVGAATNAVRIAQKWIEMEG
ncbi:MAG: aspartate-semialdehyde dehydrogenase [Campylobacterales bacterium]